MHPLPWACRGATTAITIADLGRLIARQADKAVALGALQTIATSFEIIPDHHLDVGDGPLLDGGEGQGCASLSMLWCGSSL